MEFAFEVPISYLRGWRDANINDYEFILAHLLKDKYYYDFYKESTKYKILDNSAYELGKSITIEDLVKWAYDLKVDVLIAPDHIKDKDKTIQYWEDFIREYKNLPFQLMVVPQGNKASEYLQCLDYFQTQSRADIIGLSYRTISNAFHTICQTHENDVTTTRLNLVEQTRFKKPIHLLGLESNGGIEIATNNIAKTLDSATPIILAMEGKLVNTDGTFERTIRHLDFQAEFDKKIFNLAKDNAFILKGFSKNVS